MKVINNKEKNRFELEIDDIVAVIEYELKKDKIFLISTLVPDELAGRGIGKKLVGGAVDLVKEMKLKVVPVCSFIQAWFQRNPDKRELLD